MPPVSPDDVAARFPKAPPVSLHDIQEAQDWAERELVGPAPGTDTAKGRALLRAIMAYAVALALGLDVQTRRLTVTGAATKKIKLGPIEKELFQADSSVVVASLLDSADYWLERAQAALYDAGTHAPFRAFPGASR